MKQGAKWSKIATTQVEDTMRQGLSTGKQQKMARIAQETMRNGQKLQYNILQNGLKTWVCFEFSFCVCII